MNVNKLLVFFALVLFCGQNYASELVSEHDRDWNRVKRHLPGIVQLTERKASELVSQVPYSATEYALITAKTVAPLLAGYGVRRIVSDQLHKRFPLATSATQIGSSLIGLVATTAVSGLVKEYAQESLSDRIGHVELECCSLVTEKDLIDMAKYIKEYSVNITENQVQWLRKFKERVRLFNKTELQELYLQVSENGNQLGSLAVFDFQNKLSTDIILLDEKLRLIKPTTVRKAW